MGTAAPTKPPTRRRSGRSDASAAGTPIEVPVRLARRFTLTVPLAITADVSYQAVEWDQVIEDAKPRPTGQTVMAQIAELLDATHRATTTRLVDTGPEGRLTQVPFTVWRVPPTGPHTRLGRLTPVLSIGDGDHGETVATIYRPRPDPRPSPSSASAATPTNRPIRHRPRS